MLRIVGIGGGTGLPLLMRGLRQAEKADTSDELALSAVVCVSDNGGSSGRLRESFETPALGDVRNCLVALADRRALMAQLFRYRFSNGNGLTGHALGNLILTALCQETGSLRRAVDLAAEVMQVAGAVLPVTEVPVTLCAEGEDGRRARGECEITAARLEIARVWLEPARPLPSRGVLECIDAADVIVLGPGSLYTSVIPPLLVGGVADAVRRSKALRLYACNLMAEPGETDGFDAADHLRALGRHLGPDSIDVCLANTRLPSAPLAKRYLASGAAPVTPDLEAIRALGVLPVTADLLAEDGSKARHAPLALGRLVLEIARTRARRRTRSDSTKGNKGDAVCVESSGT
jgi:uncharacterized cofD-like protein